MEVVLLERVEKLGKMGDVVKVKDGFARNFLLPRKKALRATKDNIARFERQRAELETHSEERKLEAQQVAQKLDAQSFIVIRQAGDSGQLYGSVSPRDVAETAKTQGFQIARTDVQLDYPIKTLGLHSVSVILHPEVKVQITLNVARSQEEAERQARGETVTGGPDREEALLEAEALFEVPPAEGTLTGEEDTPPTA